MHRKRAVGDESRSARELRQSLAENREQMEKDLAELGDRFQDIMNPRHLLSRHPILSLGAGALLGYLVIRRPAQLVRAVSRFAGLGAPLLLSALMKGNGSPSSVAAEETPSAPTDDNR